MIAFLKRITKYLPKSLFLFLLGGLVYAFVEVLFRGYTHISMVIVGGICFVIIGEINEKLPWDMALVSQMMISSLIITVIEFAAGVILNLWLGLAVWNYSDMPYNLLGQICLLFTVAWFLLSALAIILDDYVRYLLFGEEKPKYKIL